MCAFASRRQSQTRGMVWRATLGLAAAHMCVKTHISAGGSLGIILSARLWTGQGMRKCRLDDVGVEHDLFDSWSKIVQLFMLDGAYHRFRAECHAGGSGRS